MKGLIIKDLYALKALRTTYIIFFGLVLVFAITMKGESSMVASIFSMYIIMTSFTCFNYDELYKWDVFGITLPLSRKQIVAARYIMGLFMSVFASILSFGVSCIVALVHPQPAGWLFDVVTSVSFIFLIATLINAIIYPISFRFGAEKARYAMLFVTMAPFLLLILFQKSFSALFGGALSSLSLMGFWEILAIGAVVVLVLYFVSFMVATKIYQKKEF